VQVFINPAAGGGRARRLWPRYAAALQQHGTTLVVHWTQAPGEATAIAATAWAAGERSFLAVGGDGTVNEVLNGLAAAFGSTSPTPATDAPCLAVVPAGTGNDWAHQLGLPEHPLDWARCLATAPRRRHDVGRLRFADGRLHYFVVEAGAGFDTHVLGLLSRRGPRQLAYVSALLRGLFSFQAPALSLELQQLEDGRAGLTLGSDRSMVAFGANGPWTGGGMHIAPGARDDDGWLDFLTVRDGGPILNALRLPQLFNGRLLQHPQVQSARARRARLQLTPPMAVQCDGQVAGMTPIDFDLLPGALLVPQAAVPSQSPPR
jgi:YegS/Rv2252/BmrU family lipid kinase